MLYYVHQTSSSYCGVEDRNLRVDITIENGVVTGASRISNMCSKIGLNSSGSKSLLPTIPKLLAVSFP